jgi:hypothetical protein
MNTSIPAELQSLAQRFAEKSAKALPKGQAIWIFVAGQFGRYLCTAMQHASHTVAGFVETQRSAKEVLDLSLTFDTLCNDDRFCISQHFFNSFESVLHAVPMHR